MTKAEQILDLYPKMFAKHGKAATRLIAEKLGCLPEYVRVVARQRKGSASETDQRYAASPKGAAWRARTREYVKALRDSGNRNLARKRRNKAYAAARRNGASTKDANLIGLRAYDRALLRSADRAAARAAYHATPAEPLNV